MRTPLLISSWFSGLWLLTTTSQVLAQANPSSPGAVLWASDPLTKVLPSAKPGEARPEAIRLSGARREIASGQAVFRSPKAATGAQASISDLRHRVSGATIPTRAIRLQWVRYIDITRNSGIPPEERVAQAPASIPDPFWEASAVPLKAGEAQPLWI